MAQVEPSLERFNPHFVHLCTSAVPSKQCKTIKKSMLFKNIFINIIILPSSMYSKCYTQGLMQKKKLIFTSFICTLLNSRLNSAKPVKKLFLFNYIIINIKILPSSMYSKWNRQDLVQRNNQSSLHSFVHFCTFA